MRRVAPILVVVLAALFCAALQLQAGVRTDEAKYLLGIPYPHPPLLRTVLAWTDGWALQESLWRGTFALALAGAGLLLASPQRLRWPAILVWLTVPAVLLQSGTVMMAPLVAVATLLLLSWRHRDIDPGVIGLVWLAILLTSYQGALLFPLVAALLLRSGGSRSAKAVAFIVPVALLALYTVSHPLSAASFLLLASKDAVLPWADRAEGMVRIWVMGMGMLGAPLTLLMLWRRTLVPEALTFLLFTAYVLLGSHDYYAVFFAPFVLVALHHTARERVVPATALLMCGGLLTVLLFGSMPRSSEARQVLSAVRYVAPLPVTAVLLEGEFGHEWQYESAAPVRRFVSDAVSVIGEVRICTTACSMLPPNAWHPLDISGAMRVWQRVR